MKCKIADCLSILVSFEKKQRIRKFIFKAYDLSLNQYVLKGLATVFSLGSLRCEFQIFLHFIISGRVLHHVIYQDSLISYAFNWLSITFRVFSTAPLLALKTLNAFSPIFRALSLSLRISAIVS